MNRILLIRGGIHMEFAYQTLHKKNCESIIIDNPASKQIMMGDYQYIISDIRNIDEMVEQAIKIHDKKGYNGIVTFATSGIIPLGILSDYFKLDYFTERAARILSNKLKVRECLRELNADETKFCKVSSMEEMEKASTYLHYPFVLKPSDNASGRGVNIVRQKEELQTAFEFSMNASFNKDLIAEQLIEGDEYCVEILVYHAEVYVLSISKKLVTTNKFCIELMDITPAPISNEIEEIIKTYMCETIGKFEIHNLLIHVEFKLNKDNKPIIIEINPRAAGGKLIESIYYLKGVNVFDLLYDMALKKDIQIKDVMNKLRKPKELFSLFYSFITPMDSGVIKKIKGLPEIRTKILYDYERLNLENIEGDFLKEPKTNGEFRGSMYLFDKSPEILLDRAKEIESLLNYELEK